MGIMEDNKIDNARTVMTGNSTESKGKHAVDVPVANLTLKALKAQSNQQIKETLNAFNKASKVVADAEKSELKPFYAFAERALEIRNTWKANGRKYKEFYTWAEKALGKSDKTLYVYFKVLDNRAILGNAKSLRHAIDMVNGKADVDGKDNDKEAKGKPAKKNDADRLIDIEKNTVRFNDRAIYLQKIIDYCQEQLKADAVK